jgi:zinc/manganese transport system permease protein
VLDADAVRWLASYMQSFNEMQRGELFVQSELRQRARARERWYVGLPLVVLCGALAGLLFARRWL